nr:molybdenum cofactor cytidylyltransferase [Deltaproteobacteria bacterium]
MAKNVIQLNSAGIKPAASPKMISGIILAAGESRRMGRPKLLLPWGNTTILGKVVDTYLETTISELIVVIGDNQESLKEILTSKPVIIVENPQYHEGMSTSIRKGIEAASDQAEGYLIGLGDQPLITSDIINRLVSVFVEENPGIAVCSYKQEKGHPVVFARTFRKTLCNLTGDMGGRTIIRQHGEQVRYVDVGSKAIFVDIDTPDDYKHWIR